MVAADDACHKVYIHFGPIDPADMAAFSVKVEPVLPASAELARLYCSVIYQVVWLSGATLANRAAAGPEAVRLVTLAMTSHLTDLSVQSWGADALGQLVCNPANRAAAVECGSVMALRAAVKAHPKDIMLQFSVNLVKDNMQYDSYDFYFKK